MERRNANRLSAWGTRVAPWRHRRLVSALFAIACYWSLYSVLLPALGNAALVPSGWHYATGPGHSDAGEYAMSPDSPGLILACTTSSHFSLRRFPPSFVSDHHCWRSRDDGTHWEALRVPGNPKLLHLFVPRGGADTFYLFQHDPASTTDHPIQEPMWVTHDAGGTWKQIIVANDVVDPAARNTLTQTAATLIQGIYRDGATYSIIPDPSSTADPTPNIVVVSHDDGRAWIPTELSPSALEKAGWLVTSFAADYAQPHSWFRVLVSDSNTPRLERSNDDGASWTEIGPISDPQGLTTGFGGNSTLASTPLRPSALCLSPGTAYGMRLVGSQDGGHSWHGAIYDGGQSNTVAYAESTVQIGEDGACYQEFTLDFSQTLFMRLDPQTNAVTLTPFSDEVTSYPSPFSLLRDWSYVPATKTLPARLFIHIMNFRVGWAGWLTTFATHSDTNLLLWRPES